MRANTKKKHEIRKRFAIVIGVAAVGVMALVAQTGAQTPAPTPPPPTCNGLAATIVGTEGDGPLKGTQGPDVIVGLGGNDFGLNGGAGNDVICGGPGNDILDGGVGKDRLLGQAGKDELNGQGGKDRCEGGKGIDYTPNYSKHGVPDSAPDCEVEKSIEKSGFVPPMFH